MKHHVPSRKTLRKTFVATALCLALVTAAIMADFVYWSASPSTPAFGEMLRGDSGRSETWQIVALPWHSFREILQIAHGETTTNEAGGLNGRGTPGPPGSGFGDGIPEIGSAITVEDGVLPNGITVFDDTYPGVTNLNPNLLQALREAATVAAVENIQFYVTSGWRSPTYQNQLLHEAVSEYGSEEEAARWVATAETSAHVSGDAVDIGPVDAANWLSAHGSEYGLCQIYDNEPWHFELNPQAITEGCPPRYADPTQDSRMQQ